MKKAKSTKTAFLLSLLSMVLCVAMLAGSTFAWLSDTAETGVNKIVSGRLDVELNYWNETSRKYENAEDVSLFDENTHWEPGYTKVVYLQVKNAGTLAFNYKLSVVADLDHAGINVAGDVYKLSDYLVCKVINDKEHGAYPERKDAQEAAGNVMGLNDYIQAEDVTLNKGEEKFVALVVYMPTSVKNEVIPMSVSNAAHINLSIKVVAKQVPFENDSFNNEYDTNADYLYPYELDGHTINLKKLPNGLYKNVDETDTTFYVVDEASLRALSDLVNGNAEKGVTADPEVASSNISLLEDVRLTQNFTPIGLFRGAQFSGIFDGHGHTITNLSLIDAKNEYGMCCGFFGMLGGSAEKPAEIRNITFDGAYENLGVREDGQPLGVYCGIVAGMAMSDVTFTDVHVTNSRIEGGQALGGILGVVTGNVTMTSCTVENTTIAGISLCAGLIGSTYAGVELTDCSTSNVKWKGKDTGDWYFTIEESIETGVAGVILPAGTYHKEHNNDTEFSAAWADYYMEYKVPSLRAPVTIDGFTYEWYIGNPHNKPAPEPEVTNPEADPAA